MFAGASPDRLAEVLEKMDESMSNISQDMKTLGKAMEANTGNVYCTLPESWLA